MSRLPRQALRQRGLGVMLAAVAVAIALVAQGGVVTDASWNDSEWSRATVGTVACPAPEGAFATRGEGRALSGSLLGVNLDTLAEASGTRVTNNGSVTTPSPSGAMAVPGLQSAFADPLNVTALSGVNVNLGQGILKLPLDTSTGVLGQFGQARGNGLAAGASGFLTNTGGIGLKPAAGYPELATLRLSQLLGSVNPGVASTLAEASGTRVTNNGSVTTPSPSGAMAGPGLQSAFADPLNVTALSGVNVNLCQGILKLPLDTSTGVLGQFGQARGNGLAAGASGFLTNTGGIGLKPAAGYPELATPRLSQLLGSVNPGVASTLAEVTDVSLTSGAVAGRAANDACVAAWASSATTGLVREYLAASVRTEITSPTVGSLITGVAGTINSLERTVNELTDTAKPTNTSAVGTITSGVTTLLNGVLGSSGQGSILRLGSVEVSILSASIDLTAVRGLLTTTISDPGGVLTITPSSGAIRVDTAALLQAAYPGSYAQGLNGLPPNTNLLADPAIATALTGALTTALNGWLNSVTTALTAAINALTINVSTTINLEVSVVLVVLPVWVPIGHIAASTTGTLSSLTTSTSLVLLPGLLPVVTALLSGILSAVLNLLLSTLVSGLGGIVANAVNGVVNVFRTLPGAVTALTTPILNAVSNVYTRLFLSGVVAITVNAQNDPLTGNPEPADWASLPARRFDVAAVRIGVLDALGASAVRLYLGRGSVGPGCTLASAAAGPCAAY